jgi:signal transduction histidine kinase
MQLRFVEEGNARPVLVDPVRLREVFNNLIENAIEHCQPGTEIEVKVWRAEGAVLISISDNGPGMDPEALQVLFTPFQKTIARAPSERVRTGLGLAIVKHIVELHGGQIIAQSELGHGTRFEVSLPAY